MTREPWNKQEQDGRRAGALRLGMWLLIVVAPISQLIRMVLRPSFIELAFFFVAIAGWLAWFMYRRSMDREAKFLTVRITPDDPWETKSHVDWLAVFGSVLLSIYLLTWPWLW